MLPLTPNPCLGVHGACWNSSHVFSSGGELYSSEWVNVEEDFQWILSCVIQERVQQIDEQIVEVLISQIVEDFVEEFKSVRRTEFLRGL